MVEKKTSEPSWEQIGRMIGKKVEREFKDKRHFFWKKWTFHEEHGKGFLGRLLFIIGVLIALNTLGLINGVPIGIQILIGAGFALMRL